MTATNDLAEYIRTIVRGDIEANDRVEQRLGARGWPGWPEYLASAFYLAVDRNFTRPVSSAEIVKFVAETRTWVGDDGPDLDPLVAERLIRSVLDEDVDIDVRKLDQEMLGRIETLVVYRILSSADMSDAELDSFLESAGRIAVAD